MSIYVKPALNTAQVWKNIHTRLTEETADVERELHKAGAAGARIPFTAVEEAADPLGPAYQAFIGGSEEKAKLVDTYRHNILFLYPDLEKKSDFTPHELAPLVSLLIDTFPRIYPELLDLVEEQSRRTSRLLDDILPGMSERLKDLKCLVEMLSHADKVEGSGRWFVGSWLSIIPQLLFLGGSFTYAFGIWSGLAAIAILLLFRTVAFQSTYTAIAGIFGHGRFVTGDRMMKYHKPPTQASLRSKSLPLTQRAPEDTALHG